MDSDNKLHENSTHTLSSLAIAMIALSVLAGIGLVFVTYLLVQRKKQDTLPIDKPTCTKNFFTFSIKKKANHAMDHPMSSSLDNSDMFITILEYPPTQPQVKASNNGSSSRLALDQTTTATTATTTSTTRLDPVSASLVRQSLEERAGYYRDPSRKPVPYYQHSAISDKDYMSTSTEEWPNSTYQVW